MESKPRFIHDTLANRLEKYRSGEKTPSWAVGDFRWQSVEIGPGRMVLLGGAPGTGKSALVLQWAVEALRANRDLRVLLANVEMPHDVLIDRILARDAGIKATKLHKSLLDSLELRKVQEKIDSLIEELGGRLAFMEPPFTLDNMADWADALEVNFLILDYLQRFRVDGKPPRSGREEVNAIVEKLRLFADSGVGVLSVTAVRRVQNKRGHSSYDGAGLNLASFRESSELEFGADDAYLLVPDAEKEDILELRHVKSRYGFQQDLRLRFDKPFMRFEVLSKIPDISEVEGLWKDGKS